MLWMHFIGIVLAESDVDSEKLGNTVKCHALSLGDVGSRHLHLPEQ
jgi:hypothetical protein